jgi:hypothetical protein
MSSMDDQGHLPPEVEPGRRTGPEAEDVRDGRPRGERLHDDHETARSEPSSEPPFEPAHDGMRDSDIEYGDGMGGAS